MSLFLILAVFMMAAFVFVASGFFAIIAADKAITRWREDRENANEKR